MTKIQLITIITLFLSATIAYEYQIQIFSCLSSEIQQSSEELTVHRELTEDCQDSTQSNTCQEINK